MSGFRAHLRRTWRLLGPDDWRKAPALRPEALIPAGAAVVLGVLHQQVDAGLAAAFATGVLFARVLEAWRATRPPELSEVQQQVAEGRLTINEARTLMGLKPFGEGWAGQPPFLP